MVWWNEPFVARDARKLSWPEANAGWMLGKPPSVPMLLMLYLEVTSLLADDDMNQIGRRLSD